MEGFKLYTDNFNKTLDFDMNLPFICKIILFIEYMTLIISRLLGASPNSLETHLVRK